MIQTVPFVSTESLQEAYLKMVIGPILPRMLFGMAFLISLSGGGYIIGLTATPSVRGGLFLLFVATGISLLAIVIRRAARQSNVLVVGVATITAAGLISAGPSILSAYLDLSVLVAVPYSVLLAVGSVTFWMSTRHFMYGQIAIFLPPFLLITLSDPTHAELSFGVQIFVVAAVASTALFLLMQRVTHSSFHMSRELENRANLDGLTGALNRSTWITQSTTRLALARGRRESVSCLYIDLNGFKEVNDELGHGEGDRMLITVASTVEEVLEPRDLLGRIGGDEFAILAVGSNRADAQNLRDRIHEALSLTSLYDGTPVASIGVATADSYESLEDIVSRADMDMLEAKRRSRRHGLASAVKLAHFDSPVYRP